MMAGFAHKAPIGSSDPHGTYRLVLLGIPVLALFAFIAGVLGAYSAGQIGKLEDAVDGLGVRYSGFRDGGWGLIAFIGLFTFLWGSAVTVLSLLPVGGAKGATPSSAVRWVVGPLGVAGILAFVWLLFLIGAAYSSSGGTCSSLANVIANRLIGDSHFCGTIKATVAFAWISWVFSFVLLAAAILLALKVPRSHGGLASDSAAGAGAYASEPKDQESAANTYPPAPTAGRENYSSYPTAPSSVTGLQSEVTRADDYPSAPPSFPLPQPTGHAGSPGSPSLRAPPRSEITAADSSEHGDSTDPPRAPSSVGTAPTTAASPLGSARPTLPPTGEIMQA
ncbi:hypothetical protein CBOM_01696 [Ceraceosorus bombacis]|uniref:Uncharacterized protein n=1 Tax=Ceraceosorus bombacis TaxID=401625 RepID=A0A0P1BE45_9BASI|nr:hypothetical protein CBOM_01696 [Ceraceosorus bombacis]